MAEKTEKKSGNQIVKLALVLLAVAAIMAFVLGVVNEITKDRIAKLAEETTRTAYANVLNAPTYEEVTDFTNDVNQTITVLKIAKDDAGETVGYVAEATFSGAQGMITMVVGLDNDLTCTGVYITEHSETSGLGAKAAETGEGAWRDNVVGATEGTALAKDGGDIEAISGATITSRAVVNEVQSVIAAAKSLG